MLDAVIQDQPDCTNAQADLNLDCFLHDISASSPSDAHLISD